MKVIKCNKMMYFTNFVNNRQSVYSFYNKEAATKCRLYLGLYKHIYGNYPPVINQDTPSFNLETIPFENRESLEKILNTELILLEEDDSFLKSDCNKLNLGLVGIHTFDYNFLHDQIKIKFNGIDLFTKDIFEYNHIEVLERF